MISAHELILTDIDELALAVNPWELRMTQLSPGKLNAVMQVAAVGDLLVSSERWSNKITAVGQTPPGYLLLAGPVDDRGFLWCGDETQYQHIAFVPDCNEIDFLTCDDEHHWTVLVPTSTIKDYLGEEIIHAISKYSRLLYVAPFFSRSLYAIIQSILTPTSSQGAEQSTENTEYDTERRLLAAVSRLLLNVVPTPIDAGRRSVRWRAYRKARFFLDKIDQPISVENLARHTGVTRRCLELGFKEATGISPKSYMERVRLNALHHELMFAQEQLTVTAAAEKWGFTELGRMAGRYREMFGDLPSEALARNRPLPGIRYLDLLAQ